MPDEYVRSTYYAPVAVGGPGELTGSQLGWERQTRAGNDMSMCSGGCGNIQERRLFQSGVEESGKAFWKKQNNPTLFL